MAPGATTHPEVSQLPNSKFFVGLGNWIREAKIDSVTPSIDTLVSPKGSP